VRQWPALEPAWEDPVNRDRMPFDRVYEPVVVGTTLFVGSSRTDSLTALDTRTGEEKWRAYADGPVRLPPVAWGDRVAFVSDDGWLRCLDATTGRLVWRMRGGPDGRKVLGNGRLVSAWPARGGPVLMDGTVYFAASIWPFMGVFIHAVDAESGERVWVQDGLGSLWNDHPHGGAWAFGGVAPQGALAAVGRRLLVPGGRSVPACLERATGELRYFHLSGSTGRDGKGNPDRKREGGSHVSGVGSFFVNHRGLNTALYDLATGEMRRMWRRTTYPVLTEGVCYLSGDPVVAIDLARTRKIVTIKKKKDRKTGEVEEEKRVRCEVPTLWECKADATGALIKAGGRLYAGGEGTITALALPKDGGPPKAVWTKAVEGTVARLLAADDRLFAVTLEGHLYAFGAAEAEPVRHAEGRATRSPAPDAADLAEAVLDATDAETGYCLVYGARHAQLARELAERSALRVTLIGSDRQQVERLRRQWHAEGIYGERLTAQAGDPTTFGAPPYLARLIVLDDLSSIGAARAATWLPDLHRSLRPYGGVACVPIAERGRREAFARLARDVRLPQIRVGTTGRFVTLVREGPLPGSDDWTHAYGNAANTAKSDEGLVRLPLGLLWFGGNSHQDVLPRHGHGPSPQVAGGRLFLQGTDVLSARDVYTGQVLWKRKLPDLAESTFGVYYDKSYKPDPLDTGYNQRHIPGANARGTNFVATADRVYLAVENACRVFDAATGTRVARFALVEENGSKPEWAYLGVHGDVLMAGAGFADFSHDRGRKSKLHPSLNVTSSRKLVAMDRQSGRPLWRREATYAFRHNAICSGGDLLFCIDALPEPVIKQMKRRGKSPEDYKPRLTAVERATGRMAWENTANVFGSWLSYSSEHDLLVQAGRRSRDMVPGEPSKRIIVHRGRDGSVAWDKEIGHDGPVMIHGATLYTNAGGSVGRAVSLLTGEPKTQRHPLTGKPVRWTFRRYYGCGTALAAEHLLTFRSGAAGYYDLAHESGTGNFGGFKSGCSSNLIPGNGVLNAPDYTRTCTCSYQNQTSLAFVHMPGVETWTFNDLGERKQAEAWVRRAGLNLGAPGDRRAPNGTLWLEWPVIGGPTPRIEVEAQGDRRRPFRRHFSAVRSAPLPWVAASGLRGLRRLRVTLHPKPGDDAWRAYTVRLHFAEMQGAAPGQRRFAVSLQDQRVIEALDIAAAAGGPQRGIVREFSGIRVPGTLTIGLDPAPGGPRPPLLCGVEVVAETQ
jgi:outer membrane protein assembly factor BamB